MCDIINRVRKRFLDKIVLSHGQTNAQLQNIS